MSKSKGNVIDPWTVLDTRGADALRWYFFSAGSPWTHAPRVPRGHRRDHAPVPPDALEHLLVLRHLREPRRLDAPGRPRRAGAVRRTCSTAGSGRGCTRTVREVTDALDGFDALRGAQALEAFVDDLSNWYVRRSRPRFWKAADPHAHATLHECLATLALLLAPFCPFVADELYANLVPGAGESVHLADWPERRRRRDRRRRSKPRWPRRARS